jgi:hypothetical protein
MLLMIQPCEVVQLRRLQVILPQVDQFRGTPKEDVDLYPEQE